jgi:capsular polysaccharide biosynthesis protein
MNEDLPIKEEDHRVEHYEDEIELFDILSVIWKRKYFILLGTSICLLAAAFISFSIPKIYRIDMILQPGIVSTDPHGQKVYIDSVENIKTIIETNALKSEIIKSLQKINRKNPLKSLKLRAFVPKKSDILKVSYESDRVDFGINVLNEVYQALQEKYDELVKYYRNNYDNDLQAVKAELDILEAESVYFEQRVKRAQKRINELEFLIKDIDNRTRILIHQRNEIIQKQENGEKSFTAVLYNNTIQQNLSLSNQYRNDIKEYLYRIEDENIKDRQRKYRKQELSNNIRLLEFKKGAVQNIQILRSPTATAKPIKPKTKLNIILAFVAGLFLMLFLSFFLEYLRRQKKMGDGRT